MPKSAAQIQSTRNVQEALTRTVRHLLVDKEMKITELADTFDILPNNFSRKVALDRWMLDDLDVLARYFDCDPYDLLQGYAHMRTATRGYNGISMRDRLSNVVQHLMLDHNESLADLAAVFQLTPRGVEAKISDTRWTIDNLVVLAEHYGVEPHDIAAGYDHLVRVGTQIQDHPMT